MCYALRWRFALLWDWLLSTRDGRTQHLWWWDLTVNQITTKTYQSIHFSSWQTILYPVIIRACIRFNPIQISALKQWCLCLVQMSRYCCLCFQTYQPSRMARNFMSLLTRPWARDLDMYAVLICKNHRLKTRRMQRSSRKSRSYRDCVPLWTLVISRVWWDLGGMTVEFRHEVQFFDRWSAYHELWYVWLLNVLSKRDISVDW